MVKSRNGKLIVGFKVNKQITSFVPLLPNTHVIGYADQDEVEKGSTVAKVRVYFKTDYGACGYAYVPRTQLVTDRRTLRKF